MTEQAQLLRTWQKRSKAQYIATKASVRQSRYSIFIFKPDFMSRAPKKFVPSTDFLGRGAMTEQAQLLRTWQKRSKAQYIATKTSVRQSDCSISTVKPDGKRKFPKSFAFRKKGGICPWRKKGRRGWT